MRELRAKTEQNCLLLQRPWVWFSAPTKQLTNAYNFSSSYNALFWFLWAPHIHGTLVRMQSTLSPKRESNKIKKILE